MIAETCTKYLLSAEKRNFFLTDSQTLRPAKFPDSRGTGLEKMIDENVTKISALPSRPSKIIQQYPRELLVSDIKEKAIITYFSYVK